ncbi:polysaccharide deacetylase family protein [Streptomyces triculaminicus]|uniref:polysaccharide deacetylase family protein n=1 Tax=Streptomyces triculaminicus TaxID=2816232 RepID=UPI0033C8867D
MLTNRPAFPRRCFLAASGAALAAPLLTPDPAAATSADAGERRPLGPDHQVAAGPRAIALTFDDGPNPLYTPGVLDVLARYRVRATFFMLGANVAKYPELARQIADEGHALGNHTWTHTNLDHLPAARIRDEIRRTQDVIAETTGRTPLLFRAPGGHFAPAALTICAELGLRPIAWSIDTVDWSRPGIDRIVRTVLDEVRTGSIVLHHDGSLSEHPYPEFEGDNDRSQTVAALAVYLPQLLCSGYRFTTVTPRCSFG